VEAEGPDSDGRRAAEQQLKLYMQVRTGTPYLMGNGWQCVLDALFACWPTRCSCATHINCCLNTCYGAPLQRQFLAETKTEVKQQLLDMGIFSLGKARCSSDTHSALTRTHNASASHAPCASMCT
jgi:hypothetical protein